LADKNAIRVIYSDEKSVEIDGLNLNPEISEQIFGRTGVVSTILVYLKESNF
jgi:hypothetical protein